MTTRRVLKISGSKLKGLGTRPKVSRTQASHNLAVATNRFGAENNNNNIIKKTQMPFGNWGSSGASGGLSGALMPTKPKRRVARRRRRATRTNLIKISSNLYIRPRRRVRRRKR